MSFESELQAEIGAIKTRAFEGVKMIADEIFVNLCENSPSPGGSGASGGKDSEYSLGSFVLSHRISGGTADVSTTEVGETMNAMAVAQAHSNELPKLNSITPFQDIVISNSIEYNDLIESLGWSAGAGPYNTFQKTEGTMDTIADQIMATI
jgi:hypothetical protein